MDMTDTIVPRSDQLNAEDLLADPRTVTITDVRPGSSPEQPVSIYLAEFPADRPFKPSKTVRRILVAAWGKESSEYIGRRLTIYRDPTVKFGGQDVGGIRISHMSHITKRLVVHLTITRGKRAPYVIEPLPDVEPTPDRADRAQLEAIQSAMAQAGITERAAMLDYCRNLVGRALKSAADLTGDEAGRVLDALNQDMADAAATDGEAK